MGAVRAGGGDVSVADIVDAIAVVLAYVDGLVDIVVAEPELRSFIIRSIRSEDRGLVDNALARVVRLRAEVLVRQHGDRGARLASELEPADLPLLTSSMVRPGIFFAFFSSCRLRR
ncbi:MAG: hypothetical protein KDB24_18095 [Microthrixaceae bacterium]|nr:hypothetical protein [Microthrixaceae bacterium]